MSERACTNITTMPASNIMYIQLLTYQYPRSNLSLRLTDWSLWPKSEGYGSAMVSGDDLGAPPLRLGAVTERYGAGEAQIKRLL